MILLSNQRISVNHILSLQHQQWRMDRGLSFLSPLKKKKHLILFMFQTVQFHCQLPEVQRRPQRCWENVSGLQYAAIELTQALKVISQVAAHTSFDSNKLGHAQFARCPGLRILLSICYIKLLSNFKSFPLCLCLLNILTVSHICRLHPPEKADGLESAVIFWQ